MTWWRIALASLVLGLAGTGPGMGQGDPPAPSQQPAEGPAPAADARRPEAGGAVGAGPPDAESSDSEEARIAMRRTILRLEAEIAELERLQQWQRNLLEAARTDPESARRQRRPMAACRATVLLPWCPELTGMFAPDAGAGR